MSDSKYKPQYKNYSKLRSYETLTIEKIAEMLATHKLADKEYASEVDYDMHKSKCVSEMQDILYNNIKGNRLKLYSEPVTCVDSYGDIIEVPDQYINSLNLSEFIAFAQSIELAYPPEIVVNNTKSSVAPEIPAVETIPVKQEVDLDDVISDETILKLKELSLPQLKQQVVMLATERNKWDASMLAATKIGILFYEGGLPKPATLEVFISEYKKHLDALPNLPDTAIKKIYKYLPDGYRHSKSGGRATKDKSQTVDINPIIKAAVYAGSMHETSESKKLPKLKAMLAEYEYSIPSDEVLLKIIEAVKDI